MSVSTWPVLRFEEQYDFGSGDRGYLEVSTTGTSWTAIYAVSGRQTDWQPAKIDLSPYKNQENLRIRFRIQANHDASVGDGWKVASFEIDEHPGGTLALPFREDFSSGLSNWITGGWSTRESAETVKGTNILADTVNDLHWSDLFLTLEKEVDLSAATDPQLVFWYRGSWVSRHYMRLQISTNGGLNWTNTNIAGSTNGATVPNWTRLQHSLQSYVGQTIRIRFVSSNYYGGYTQTGRIDALTIQERPQNPILYPVTDIGVAALSLQWEQAAIDGFVAYRIYRANTSTVSENSTLIAEITDPDQTQFTDTGLQARTSYHYRIYTVNDDDVTTPSNTTSSTTLAIIPPWSEDFAADVEDNWTLTGDWQVIAGLGKDGSLALVDSVGDYSPSRNTYAQTALDLTGTQWPVLRFTDRHDLGAGDFAYLEISTNEGSSWTTVYSLRATRFDWRENQIDLAPYQTSDSVWIRFRLQSNADASVGNGWRIDKIEVWDNQQNSVSALVDEFNHGQDAWITAGWQTQAETPFIGAASIRDTIFGSLSGESSLVYSRTIDLSETDEPLLTYWLRAQLPRYYYFRVQISTDDGLIWSDLPGTYRTNTTISDWTRFQIDLSAYKTTPVRIRFRSHTSSWYTGWVDVDRIGLGDSAPGKPELLSPFFNETVEVFRPVLRVRNAIDYQNDPVNYQFEVYADTALEDLVAQVPSVASGATETIWQVDVNLPDNAAYWWRTRAFKGDRFGDWTNPSVFNVNELNNPPYPVIIAGPPNGTVVFDLSTRLFWHPTTDPDVGDTILDYDIQVARETGFNTIIAELKGILVDDSFVPDNIASISLHQLMDPVDFKEGNYYWRIRAQDSRFRHSEWSETMNWFRYPDKLTLWRSSLFDHGDYQNADLSGPLADTNGDGIPNLIKFLHGGSPFASHDNDRPVLKWVEDGGANHLAIEFALHKAHGLNLRFEASNDGLSWTATAGNLTVLEALDADTDWVRFTEDIPSTHPSRMLRIRASSTDGYIAFSTPPDPDASISYLLNLTALGNGSIVVDPLLESYLPGTEITVTALPAENAAFVNWTGYLTSTNNPLSLTINTDVILTAAFRALIAPSILSISSDAYLAPATHTTLSVVAENAASYQWYRGESGDLSDPIADADRAELEVTSEALGAYWVKITSADGLSKDSDGITVGRAYTVSMNTQGSGTVVANPAGTEQAEGTEVTFSAYPAAGSLFRRWVWNGGYVSVNNPLTIELTENLEVTATFADDFLVLESSRSIFGYAGSELSFNIMTSRSWNVETDAAWIEILTPTGSGDGAISFTIHSNPGAARNAIIWIDDAAHSVSQVRGPFTTLFDPCDNYWTSVIDDQWRYSHIHGFIYTEHYPWVQTLLHSETGPEGWWWIHEDGSDYQTGYYFYHPATQTWHFTGADHYPMVYVFEAD